MVYMKILIFISLLLKILPSNAQPENAMKDESPIELFAKVSKQLDYSNYSRLAQMLGFDVAKVETSKLTTSNDKTNSIQSTHVVFANTARTAISKATKNADFNSFASQKGITRVTLNVALESNAICITKEDFLEYFSPVNSISSTDGGIGLSHEFNDTNKRVVWATFDRRGCVNMFVLMQN